MPNTRVVAAFFFQEGTYAAAAGVSFIRKVAMRGVKSDVLNSNN